MNNKILKCRKRIDNIDKKILDLLNDRAAVAVEIGKMKQSFSAVYVPSRETEIINNLSKNNKGLLNKKDISSIYTEIISVCRAMEQKLTVAYLGPKATFSH